MEAKAGYFTLPFVSQDAKMWMMIERPQMFPLELSLQPAADDRSVILVAKDYKGTEWDVLAITHDGYLALFATPDDEMPMDQTGLQVDSRGVILLTDPEDYNL